MHIYFAGIDLGSTMTKAVIVGDDEKIRARVVGPTGAEHRHLANKVMEEALGLAGLSFDEISHIVATGYGRINVPFADRQITELTCHATGIASFFPNVSIAIDIGGQDAKGLKIINGKLADFVMNDKCAAGTGRFLEVIANTLSLKVEDLGNISAESSGKVTISSTCTVFARQEVIAYLSQGVPLADIIAGLHDSIASRVARMVKRLKVAPDVVFTGGVAKNAGVVRALKENLGCEIFIPEEPLFSGAIGAALLGKAFTLEAMDKGEAIPRKQRFLDEATFFK
ncbi:acyl-CoA dehydratase activase [Chloroflexota bacterium]